MYCVIAKTPSARVKCLIVRKSHNILSGWSSMYGLESKR